MKPCSPLDKLGSFTHSRVDLSIRRIRHTQRRRAFIEFPGRAWKPEWLTPLHYTFDDMIEQLSLLIAKVPIPPTWPDDVDRVLTSGYVALIIGLPLLGYVFMVLDFRRYLRSLRRALMVVAQVVPVTPYWVLRQRPACMMALNLQLPCTEEEVVASYRNLAKTLHPDRGGDLQKFLRLQKHFEQALRLVRMQSTVPVEVRP